MASVVAENRHVLGRRHYIRQATSRNYWVDFTKNVLDTHLSRFGKNFCLVINHSDTENDAYVLPYSAVADLLTEETLDPDSRGWSGTIKNNLLRIGGSSIVVSGYFNAYHLLVEPTGGTEQFNIPSDNIIVVCPNCHRMLHYAEVSFLEASGAKVSGSINGTPFTFDRNILSGS